MSLKHLVKVSAFILLALSWFSGIVVAKGITITKAAGIIVATTWFLYTLGRWAITKKIRKIEKENRILIFLILSYLVIGLFSILFAYNIHKAFARLFALFMLFVMSIIFYDQFSNDEDFKIAYKILTYSGISLGIFIIIQIATGISFSNIFTPETNSKASFIMGYARATGVFKDPNYAALSVLTTIPLAYYLAKIYHGIIKFFLYLGLLTSVLAILFSFSRSGIISLAIVLLIIFLCEQNKFRLIAVIAITLLPVLYYLPIKIITLRMETIIDFLKNFNNLTYISQSYGSIWKRYELLLSGWHMFTHNLLCGVGIGNFVFNSVEYGAITAQVAHNTYLSVAAELGILGIILFLSIINFEWKNFKVAQIYSKDTEIKTLLQGLKISLIAFIFDALFLTAQYERIFWVLLSFSMISISITTKKQLLSKAIANINRKKDGKV